MRHRVPDVLFFLALGAHVILVWAFPVFPTQDGPAHLENALLLVDVVRRDPTALEFFALDRPTPNWLSHLVLAPLVLLVPGPVAEKLMLTACTLAVPLGFRRASRAVGAPLVAALLGLPFVHSWLFCMGFLNFVLGSGIALVALAWWIEAPRSILRAGAGLVAVYLCHPLPFVFAAGAIVVMAFFRGRVIWMATTLALLPGALVLGAFLANAHEGPAAAAQGPDRLLLVETLGVLVAFARAELTVSTLYWILIGCAALAASVRAARTRSWRDGLALAAALAILATFVVPFEVGGGAYVPERVLFLGALALALWVGARAPGELLPPLLGGAGALASLALIGLRIGPIAERNRELADYRSVASTLDRGSLVVALNGTHTGQRAGITKVDSLHHAVGYLALERDLVDLTNYQPDTGHFPLRFLDSRTPWDRLLTRAEAELAPPSVDLLRYERETGRAIDYVLTWDFEASTEGARVRAIESQLASGYERAATSPSGRMVVFRRSGR